MNHTECSTWSPQYTDTHKTTGLFKEKKGTQINHKHSKIGIPNEGKGDTSRGSRTSMVQC